MNMLEIPRQSRLKSVQPGHTFPECSPYPDGTTRTCIQKRIQSKTDIEIVSIDCLRAHNVA